MMMMLTTTLMIMLIVFIIYSMSYILSMQSKSNTEKQSPFECGFDPNHQARIPFSMRFFLLAIIFIVFDIEIALLMPIPLMLYTINQLYFMLMSFMFILILLMGIMYEWLQGSLNWSL